MSEHKELNPLHLASVAKWLPELIVADSSGRIFWKEGQIIRTTELEYVCRLVKQKMNGGQQQIYTVKLAEIVLKSRLTLASTFYVSEVRDIDNAPIDQRLAAFFEAVGKNL